MTAPRNGGPTPYRYGAVIFAPCFSARFVLTPLFPRNFYRAIRCRYSAAVLFNGIKESWRLARKILFLVLTVIREILTLLVILHLEIAKNLFTAGSVEQLNSPL